MCENIIFLNQILEADDFELDENKLFFNGFKSQEKSEVILETCVLLLTEINSEDSLSRNLVFKIKEDNLLNRKFLQRICFIENVINKLLNSKEYVKTNILPEKRISFKITNNTEFFKNNSKYETEHSDIKCLYKNVICKCLVKISDLTKTDDMYIYHIELLEIVIE